MQSHPDYPSTAPHASPRLSHASHSTLRMSNASERTGRERSTRTRSKSRPPPISAATEDGRGAFVQEWHLPSTHQSASATRTRSRTPSRSGTLCGHKASTGSTAKTDAPSTSGVMPPSFQQIRHFGSVADISSITATSNANVLRIGRSTAVSSARKSAKADSLRRNPSLNASHQLCRPQPGSPLPVFTIPHSASTASCTSADDTQPEDFDSLPAVLKESVLSGRRQPPPGFDRKQALRSIASTSQLPSSSSGRVSSAERSSSSNLPVVARVPTSTAHAPSRSTRDLHFSHSEMPLRPSVSGGAQRVPSTRPSKSRGHSSFSVANVGKAAAASAPAREVCQSWISSQEPPTEAVLKASPSSGVLASYQRSTWRPPDSGGTDTSPAHPPDYRGGAAISGHRSTDALPVGIPSLQHEQVASTRIQVPGDKRPARPRNAVEKPLPPILPQSIRVDRLNCQRSPIQEVQSVEARESSSGERESESPVCRLDGTGASSSSDGEDLATLSDSSPKYHSLALSFGERGDIRSIIGIAPTDSDRHWYSDEDASNQSDVSDSDYGEELLPSQTAFDDKPGGPFHEQLYELDERAQGPSVVDDVENLAQLCQTMREIIPELKASMDALSTHESRQGDSHSQKRSDVMRRSYVLLEDTVKCLSTTLAEAGNSEERERLSSNLAGATASLNELVGFISGTTRSRSSSNASSRPGVGRTSPTSTEASSLPTDSRTTLVDAADVQEEGPQGKGPVGSRISAPIRHRKASISKLATQLRDEIQFREGTKIWQFFNADYIHHQELYNVLRIVRKAARQPPEMVQAMDKERRAAQTLRFPELIDILTGKQATMCPDLLDQFFVGFRLQISSEVLLRLLIAKYDRASEQTEDGSDLTVDCDSSSAPLTADGQTKDRVLHVLLRWIELYWHSDLDVGAAPLLDGFKRRILPDLPADTAARLCDALVPYERDRLHYRGAGLQRHLDELERLAPTKFHEPSNVRIPRIDNLSPAGAYMSLVESRGSLEELAKQITLCQYELFRRVHPEDAARIWMKECKELTPSDERIRETLSDYAAFNTAIMLWTQSTILSATGPKQRGKVIGRFILLAVQCVLLSNHSAAHTMWMSVVATVISRLGTTLDETSTIHLRSLKRIFGDVHKNHRAYRSLLAAEPLCPCLPIVPLMYRDFLHLRERGAFPRAHDDSVDVRVHLSDYHKLFELIKVLERGHRPFGIPRNDDLCRWVDGQLRPYRYLSQSEVEDVQAELYRKSCEIRPRGS